MRDAPNIRLENIRKDGPCNTPYGAFRLGELAITVSAGAGWDHVSVSRVDRCPSWPEMDRVKRLVFRDDEIVMQLHVTDARKIDVHPYCLHLWRPQTAEEIAAVRAEWIAGGEAWPYGELAPPPPIPLPPPELV